MNYLHSTVFHHSQRFFTLLNAVPDGQSEEVFDQPEQLWKT